MEDNLRKQLIMLVMALLVVCVGAGITFAFFSVSLKQDENITVDVTTSDRASVTYNDGADLNLVANEPGATATSYFNVKVESSGTGSVTGVYDIYWEISSNSFVHDGTNDKEIIYSLYSSPDNNTWTPIVVDADATAITGSVRLATNEIVKSENGVPTTKYYKLQVTYPNLAKDQSINMDKELKGYVEIKPSI